MLYFHAVKRGNFVAVRECPVALPVSSSRPFTKTPVDEAAALTSAPLSVHPDPEHFVETPANPFSRIKRVIDVSDGGVIGVTGERGAGKSVLLHKISQEYRSSNLTVFLSSPIGTSKDMEFFIMLFRHLVERVMIELRKCLETDNGDIRSLGRMAVAREVRVLALSLSGLYLSIALLILALYGWGAQAWQISRAEENLNEVRAEAAQDSAGRAAVENAEKHLSDVRLRLSSPWVTWDFARLKHSPFVLSIPACASLFVAVLVAPLTWRLRVLIKHPSLDERGLLALAESLATKLDYELTRTTDRGVEFTPANWLKGTAKLTSQHKARAVTLPDLTSDYISFVQSTLRVIPGRLVVCIDELDKVTDLDQIRFILREIKGALYVRGTFYLLSISADALRSFEGRMGDQRDVIESTFDDVFPVRSLDLATCMEILKTRIASIPKELGWEAPDDMTLAVISVFSAGNARDLIRGFRECMLSGSEGRPTDPLSVWTLLFSRRAEAITDRVAIAGGSPGLRRLFVPLINQVLRGPISNSGQSVEVRRTLHSFVETVDKESEDWQVAHRFLKYAAELEIILRIREELTPGNSVQAAGGQSWMDTAAYLMTTYQILPFSLFDCEELLERYNARTSTDTSDVVQTADASLPLAEPISDRGPGSASSQVDHDTTGMHHPL